MSNSYIAPAKRALHQRGFKALMLVQFFTVLAFVQYLPIWFLLVFALVVIWRWRVMRGNFIRPPRWLVFFSIGTGVIAIWLSGFNHYTLDTGVAFCILGYLLKSLEVLRRRDGIFQVYLGYFLSGVYLLYSFDPLAALLVIGLIFLNTLALQAVTADGYFRWLRGMRQSALLLIAAVPVMVAGYLFFPRIPPLWVIPNEQRGGVTGMSDEITPGSVAELAQSTAPAFRVSFDGEMPQRQNWYWRGNTLTQFDGKSWKASYRDGQPQAWPQGSSLPEAAEDGIAYSVIIESTKRKWLYFLDWPVSAEAEGAVVLPDARLATRRNILDNYRYRAVSSSMVIWDNQESIIGENLALPARGNEELRRWAVDARRSFQNDQAFLDYIAAYIQTEDYYYTLRPPLYQGSDSLADFWLGSRRGFCSHYASSVAYILRAAGVPARLVGGYLGGVYNNRGDYIQVRQMEAHVWVEVWLDDRWQRFDPTTYVAPGRADLNLDGLLAETNVSELPVFSRMQRLSWVNSAGLYWDSILYQWQRSVLDYDNNRGIAWFESHFGQFSPIKLVVLVLLLMASVALFVGVVTGVIVWPKRIREPYRSLSKLEKRFGRRLPGETVRMYFQRLSSETGRELTDITAQIENHLYQTKFKADTSKLKSMVRRQLRTK